MPDPLFRAAAGVSIGTGWDAARARVRATMFKTSRSSGRRARPTPAHMASYLGAPFTVQRPQASSTQETGCCFWLHAALHGITGLCCALSTWASVCCMWIVDHFAPAIPKQPVAMLAHGPYRNACPPYRVPTTDSCRRARWYRLVHTPPDGASPRLNHALCLSLCLSA